MTAEPSSPVADAAGRARRAGLFLVRATRAMSALADALCEQGWRTRGPHFARLPDWVVVPAAADEACSPWVERVADDTGHLVAVALRIGGEPSADPPGEVHGRTLQETIPEGCRDLDVWVSWGEQWTDKEEAYPAGAALCVHERGAERGRAGFGDGDRLVAESYAFRGEDCAEGREDATLAAWLDALDAEAARLARCATAMAKAALEYARHARADAGSPP